MKRTRLKPRSAKKIESDKAKPAIREAVYRRDNFACVLGNIRHDDVPDCFGHITPHHLRKEKQGGKYVVGNLVTLCSGCNDWVEQAPLLAHELGLVCRSGDTLDDCWSRMRVNGLVAW